MTAVKQASIHSAAFNFDEFMVGGVDPRTGIYTCSLTLGDLTSGSMNGPSLPVRLFFSPLQGGDEGLGRGWSLALTRYDTASGLLTLSGGERYKARQTATHLVFDELKLETLKVLRPAPGRFNVVHKTGQREELSVYGGSDLAVPTKRIEFQYEQPLGGRVTQRKATGLLASYEYHPQLGELTQCVEQQREVRLEYFLSGRLKREVVKVEGSEKNLSYTYSQLGRPLGCIDALGDEHKTEYDAVGRPQSFHQPALKVAFAYNALGQLATIDAKASDGQGSMITRLAYDDLGREVGRTFEMGAGITQTLTSSYTLAGKLAQKTLKQGDEILRSEQFTYDERGRLKAFGCTGTQRPRDSQGNEIIQQTYVFDAFDNIVSLETDFPGGRNLASFEFSASDPTQ